MASTFPTSVDAFNDPVAANKLNNPDHAVLHQDVNDAIEKTETKLGTGSSTPVSNTFLIGNGSGTSAWSALTSAQVAARISDETGTGLLVFGTSPTIVTPIIASFVNATHDHSNAAGGGQTLNTPIIVNPTIRTWDGWQDANETWTYASATTFTVAGVDVTAKYHVGTKLKLTQTSAKYFYVTAVSFSTDTTVTVTGGSDYTLANAAITNPFFSYMVNPQGFPRAFSWTPTFVNLSGGTLNYAKFGIQGGQCFFELKYTLAGAGVAGAVTFSAPTSITADMVSTIEVIEGSVALQDTGTAAFGGILRWGSSTTIEIAALGSAGSYINVTALSSTVPHTWASTDAITAAGRFRIA